jgi:hypothetical protein
LRGKGQAECYHELLEERKDSPCSPREQAGDYWDEELQCDRRTIDSEETWNENDLLEAEFTPQLVGGTDFDFSNITKYEIKRK